MAEVGAGTAADGLRDHATRVATLDALEAHEGPHELDCALAAAIVETMALAAEFVEEAAATPTMSEEISVPPTATTDGDACKWCHSDLPNPDTLNYCPFCGTDLRLVPCGSCGAELGPGWRFCASCGSEASD